MSAPIAACWCGKPGSWQEFPEQGSPITLCAEHQPQYEIKQVRGPIYGPKKPALLALSAREIDDLNNRVRPAINKFLDATGREGGKASMETRD